MTIKKILYDNHYIMNIIILIIADDTKQYYIDMQNIQKKYMNTHKQIKSYFVKFSQIIENIVIK